MNAQPLRLNHAAPAEQRHARRWAFNPSPATLVLLEGLAGALAYTLALALRFLDEGSIPASYAIRALPWAVLAFLIQAAAGLLTARLRHPRARLVQRPVLPFVLAAAAALALALLVNYGLLPLAWRLPLSVIVIGPLLASAASAALRLAAAPRPLNLEALLPRPVVQLDVEACAPALRDRRVLITGAAGSIGSEIARQVLRVSPAQLVLVDVNESGLFDLGADLNGAAQGDVVSLRIADVTDADGLARLLALVRPQVVFHAAAYKHVPLLEDHPDRGFQSNVVGTLSVLEAAAAAGVDRVVVISTDKAVNPSSVMGLTKRVAELLAAAFAQRRGGMTVSVVRFGNVLGSRGSVVPLLLRQIDAGQPLTITDPAARRYFMTIAEAASLVIRSAAFGGDGSLYVLEMGQELPIQALAERLVRMKGLTPGKDVPFRYIGLRPGEKLTEELVSDNEQLEPTEHPYVRRVRRTALADGEQLLAAVRELEAQRQAHTLDPGAIPDALRSLIDHATGVGVTASS